MNYYLGVLQKYAVFNGRAHRAEFWYFVLFNLIATIIFRIADMTLGTFDSQAGVGILGALYSLAVLLPSIGVSIRRLHDTGKTGWWLLLAFIPLIGLIVLLVFMAKDSDQGPNEYGNSPKLGEGIMV